MAERWSRCISVCFLQCKFEHFWAKKYFKHIPGRAVLRYMDILFIPGTLENAGFWTVWIYSFHPNSKSVLAHFGRSLHVPFLPLSGSVQTTSSSLLLLLKSEFISQVSLSESSLKLPVRIIQNFTYFISSNKHFLWSTFCTRTWSRIFHVPCGAQNISWLLRPHWYFRPTCWERKVSWFSASRCRGASCDKTKARIESNNKTACCATVP